MAQTIRMLMLVLLFARLTKKLAAVGVQPQGCNTTCGNLTIPYPFGIGDGCYEKSYGNFNISCDQSEQPPKAYINTGNIEVLAFNLTTSQLRILSRIGSDCYDAPGGANTTSNQRFRLSTINPYTLSHTRNSFFTVGCDSEAFIVGRGGNGSGLTGGCISYCSAVDVASNVDDGSCSGVGCCKTAIPKGLRRFSTDIRSFDNHTNCWDFNPCTYAFVAEEGKYTFQRSDLNNTNSNGRRRLPIVINWSIGNKTCEEVEKGGSTACLSRHSECLNSESGVGYICKCSEGYQGNPYLQDPDGCQDIDECLETPALCDGKCKNTEGGFQCIRKRDTWKWVLGLGAGALLIVLLTGTCIHGEFQRRRLAKQKAINEKMKQKLFEQNGGRFLVEEISSRPGNTFKIFTEEELATATKSFHEDNVIGRGGHGIVYKGTMEDGITQVAIKKSKMVDERQSKEFAREMAILSKINHVNVVKLLGCCLEVEIPMLVYEFIPSGTLHDYIHDHHTKGSKHGCTSGIPMATRLRIAKEVAEALAYLHSHASERPIIHRDVKTSNVLLDERCRAKVSDFGASILVSADKEELNTLVQGTWGYLDPEYMQGYELTEKSDVYSFGVVLAELLTGKKPIDQDGGLAKKFVCSVRDNKLIEIVDAQIETEEEMKRLMEVAEIVMRCLSVKGEDRPTMKDVAMALHMSGELRGAPMSIDPYGTPEEAESLLGTGAGSEPSVYQIREDGITCTISLNNSDVHQIEYGR